MAATYPGGIKTFSTRTNGQTITPDLLNDPDAEITAIETALKNGFAHALIPNADDTYDLGAALTRWHDLFLSGGIACDDIDASGSVSVGGLLSVDGFGDHHFSSSGSGPNQLTLRNTAAGSANSAVYKGISDEATGFALWQLSSTFNTPPGSADDPANVASTTQLVAARNGGLVFVSANGATRWYAGNATAERMRLSGTGGLGIGTTTDPGAGSIILTGDILDGAHLLKVATAATTSNANLNNFDPGHATLIVCDAQGGSPVSGNLTGIVAPSSSRSRVLFITGISIGAFNVINQSGSSSAANRFATSTGADMDVSDDTDLLMAVYSTQKSRWIVSRLSGS